MHAACLLSLVFPLLPLTTSAETVLGVYIFSRHGDRTSKSAPATVLTPLGYSEVFSSGNYYRDRYISQNASSPIKGIAPNLVNLAQISASAPLDNVLMPSAQGFLQGLYPPVGATLSAQTLRDNRSVEAPLDGYQLIPVQTVTAGTGSEDSAWLQGAGNCANAITSSNAYFLSSEYQSLSSSTGDFYKNLVPVVNATFSADKVNYKNAYSGRYPNFNCSRKTELKYLTYSLRSYPRRRDPQQIDTFVGSVDERYLVPTPDIGRRTRAQPCLQRFGSNPYVFFCALLTLPALYVISIR